MTDFSFNPQSLTPQEIYHLSRKAQQARDTLRDHRLVFRLSLDAYECYPYGNATTGQIMRITGGELISGDRFLIFGSHNGCQQVLVVQFDRPATFKELTCG